MEIEKSTRPLTMNFIRKELQKLGNYDEEIAYYVWHYTNGRKEEANEYIQPLKKENQMRIDQGIYNPEPQNKM